MRSDNKPFYQQPWFWLGATAIAICLVASAAVVAYGQPGPTPGLSPHQVGGKKTGNYTLHLETPVPQAGAKTYSVKHPDGSGHDNLWDVAQIELGDPNKVAEIKRLNPWIETDKRVAKRGGKEYILVFPDEKLLLPLDFTNASAVDSEGQAIAVSFVEVPAATGSQAQATSSIGVWGLAKFIVIPLLIALFVIVALAAAATLWYRRRKDAALRENSQDPIHLGAPMRNQVAVALGTMPTTSEVLSNQQRLHAQSITDLAAHTGRAPVGTLSEIWGVMFMHSASILTEYRDAPRFARTGSQPVQAFVGVVRDSTGTITHADLAWSMCGNGMLFSRMTEAQIGQALNNASFDNPRLVWTNPDSGTVVRAWPDVERFLTTEFASLVGIPAPAQIVVNNLAQSNQGAETAELVRRTISELMPVQPEEAQSPAIPDEVTISVPPGGGDVKFNATTGEAVVTAGGQSMTVQFADGGLTLTSGGITVGLPAPKPASDPQ